MSQLIKQEDGTELEVFTADEIDQQRQDAIDVFRAENPDKTEELTALQEELQKAKDELIKKSDADKNFANLRKAKEEAEVKLSEFTKDIEEKMNSMKREVIEGVNKDFMAEKLADLSGGDEELKKKIEFEYNNTLKGVVPASKVDIIAKLNKAYILANPSDVNALNSTVVSSGGVGRIKINTNQKFSTEEKELGARFGLNAKDFGDK